MKKIENEKKLNFYFRFLKKNHIQQMITTEQKIINEIYFLNIMRFTKMYSWIDEKEIYMIENNKMIAQTDNGYLKLSQIVRPKFMSLFVQKK